MNWPLERFARLRRDAHFGRAFTYFAERPARLNALFAQPQLRRAAGEAPFDSFSTACQAMNFNPAIATLSRIALFKQRA